MAAPTVLFLMADYGHDPTETAVPFTAFKEAGFEISIATEKGKSSDADEKMLSGMTQKLLGANQAAVQAYRTMKEDPCFQSPLSWSSTGFSFEPYNLLFLPGGHEKGVKQVIESPIVKKMLAVYFPETRKPSQKHIAAICHGVLVASEATYPGGKSLLHDVTTTTLPAMMESTAFWGTRLFLGDYYKTYGPKSDSCENMVRKRLDKPEQMSISNGMSPFIVKDPTYNCISGRFPPDAQLLAQDTIVMVKESMKD
ncbi:hypothetical protein MMC09_003948 [Bachmanniomyces sp. S44760]|nr:hypothetical protein [Bachmanniomyces sp. S44760]